MQNDQQLLQQQLQNIVGENNRNNSKVEILKGSVCTGAISNDDTTHEKLTDDAFKHAKRQINYLQAENNDLRQLHKTAQNTIENLEKEIQSYRNQLFQPTSLCEVKHKYSTAMKLLESTIINQKSELQEQAHIIESLFDQKKSLRDQLDKLEKTVQEKEAALKQVPDTQETVAKLRDDLKDLMKHNIELQKSLKISKIAIEERFKREQNALRKVQEALSIAEAAVADKDDALKRESVLKEECDNIASTIGQVMDEAAKKVEKDMEAVKRKYLEKEKCIMDDKNKLLEEIQNLKKFNQILDTRCNRFEQKYKESVKDNDRLSQQLELAAKTLYEMEKSVDSNVHQSQLHESAHKKKTEDQEMEVRYYIETNKQLKERYRNAMTEMSNDFKKEIHCLQNEILTLKKENQTLKLQKTCDVNNNVNVH